MNDVSELICEDLDLDMLRMLDIVLDVHRRIAESLCCFALCRKELALELDLVPCNAHALTAAACRSLDDYRECCKLSELQSCLDVGCDIAASRDYRNACFDHGALCLGLVACSCDLL